jgi:hypothetical protein
MQRLREIKIGLLLSAFISGVAAIVSPSFESASFIVDFAIFIMFMNEIPAILNRFYRTKLFKQKRTLRFSVVGSFLILYLVIAVCIGGSFSPFLIPQSPLKLGPSELTTLFFFSALSSLLLIALIISIGIRKHPELITTMLKRMETREQYEADAYEMANSKIGYLLGIYTAGLIIAALTLFLLLLWVLLTLLTPLFLLVIGLWIAHNILSLRNKDPLSRVVSAIVSSDAQVDTTFGWRGILRPLLSEARTMPISILVFMCYGILAFFLITFLTTPVLLFLFWILSCLWYPFLMLIFITTRLSTELHLLSHPDQPAKAIRLPPKKDFVTILASLNMLALTVIVVSSNIVNRYTVVAVLLLSAITNLAALASIVLYLKRKTYQRKENVEQSSFMNDRTRLVFIALIASTAISAFTRTHIAPEMVSILGLTQILWVDVHKRTDNWRPLRHALVYAASNFLIMTLIVISIAFFEFSGVYPFEGLVLPLLVTGFVIFIVSIPISYHGQIYKLRKRRKTDDD